MQGLRLTRFGLKNPLVLRLCLLNVAITMITAGNLQGFGYTNHRGFLNRKERSKYHEQT